MPETTVKPETEEDAASGGGAQKDNKKFDAGQYAGDAGRLFLNGVAEGFAATGAAVENWIGKGLDKLFPGAGFEGSGLFNVLYNGRPDWKWAGENGLVGIKQDREYNQESLQENADRIDSKVLKKAAEFGGDIAYGLGNAAPMAATAMATGGASAAASLTKEGLMKTGAEVVEKSGVLNSLSRAAREMLTSQDYWTSFASEVGMDYYDALDNGATEDEALRYALSSAGLNSVIEIGGGIQKIPEKPTFKTWLKSAHEEGMEEIQQGVVSRLLENVVYKKGNPIASVTDEHAVFNPVTALGEYAGGAAVGGILSGGQQLAQRGINDAQYRKAYGNNAQALVDESLELNPDNELAKKAQKKLDAGKKLTGSELRQLVEQNETDIMDGDRATIQTAVEDRLTELGESDNVRQLAEIVARQMAGEELSRDEQMQIDGSKYGKRVLDELNPENVKVDENGNPRDTYSSSWTGSIGTSVIDPVTFNRNIGVTGAKYNQETQKLDAIVKDSEGNIQTVPLEEAKASPMQEELFDWAEELKEAGPVMVGAYQATQNLELYAKSFRLAYEYGKAHVPMDYVENSDAVNYLHPVQLKLAYEEGRKAQQRQTQATEKEINSGGTRTAAGKKKPAVSLGGATVGGITYAPVDRKALNRRQWAAVEAMRTFSKATGVAVVFYQSQANEKGRYEGANGFYRDGTIYLDINAGRNRTQDVQETAVLKTAAHELTHFIQQNSPTQYEELKQFVVEKLTREEGISFDDLVTDKQRREHGLSYEEAVDEVVADACEMMLKDSKAVEQLARENRSLAERIRQWIRKWVRSLKAAMEGLTADRPESRTMVQYAEELQKLWDDALVEAARNGRGTVRKNAPAENRQSIRETSDGKKYVKADRQVLFGSDPDSWSEQLEDYINGKIRRGQDVQLIAEDGDVILLTSTSAGKLSDNHTSDGRTMSDAAFERKANAAAHIDELVEVSSKGKKTVIDKDARHGDMASGGWNYRTAYFMDFDGKYYKTTISVAEGAGGSIVYNVGKMQERSTPQFGGSSGKTGALRGNASDERSSTRRTLHADDTQSARGGESNAQPKEKVISSTSFSAQRRSEVFEPKPSPKQYMQNSRESQAEISDTEQRQMREYRMSDRDVLRMAAGMAKNDRSNRWAVEDKNRLELLERRMLLLDEINAELAALQEERATILSGRKKSELKGEDRNELIKTENRIQIAKDQIESEEARAFNLVSMDVYKPLLKKARSIVEQDAANRARTEYREKREAAEQMAVTRRKVERTAKRLTEYMTTNTDKKHIPEALKKPIGELLESLDFSAKKSGRTTRADLKYIEAMQDLQAALAAQRLFDDTGEGTDLFKGYMDLPAGFESLLAVHVEKVKNALEKHPLKTGLVRAMDIDDLKELDVILSVMSRSVTRMNEMFVNRRFALVSEAAENSIDTMSELGQHQDKTGERFMLWDNTLPWYAFQRFGEGGKAVFEGLQDGWDKLAFNMKTVLDFRKDLIEDALARKWDTEKHRVELTDPDGATVTAVLTTAQLMSLHCLSKRKQALGHLLGGGIRPSAIELTDSIGDRIKKRSLNQDKQFKLTEESLAHLLGLLTPEQVKIADAMQKFMTEQGSLWGNEVTMIRFGYRGFTEQNYFPIETDAQDRQAKTGDTKDGSLYRLQNISAVKPLVKNANNALVLRGIFDVFANHTADMAKYNALVLPILDAQKWYNYKYASKNEAGQISTRTVQRAMTKAYGGAANNYVIKYLQDLNGVKESGDRGDTLAKKMISNYKRAMVAANMRVALLQPTAYARASAVLDYEYLAKAFADKTSTKQATEEMLQHSGIALWKSLGFFDTDVGRSIRDQIKGKSSKLENFVDKTMVPAEKGDEITWARLWRACKLEVQDKQKLTGDELLKATAERFREVVYRTQVVDSTMTRSHTMRSNGTLSKMATSFMSEPTMSYNMVMESTRQTVGDAKRMGMRVAIRRNWKALGRSLQAYVMSAAVTAIVESLYDALRDPDDDEYMEKVWKAFGGEKPETAKDQVLSIIFGLNGNFAGDINPIGKVPYLRDVVSILGGYSNGRMDTEAVANLKKAIDIWDEVIRLKTGDLDKATKTTYYGNMTTYGMIYPTAKALSQLTGLPGSAAMREVATAWNTTVGTVWPALKMRTYEDKKLREAWENYGKDSGVSYAVMYRAIQELKEFESDRDADGNAISGSLKAKYVEYIRGMSLTRAQEKAVWEAAKNSSWSDKGTPWG